MQQVEQRREQGGHVPEVKEELETKRNRLKKRAPREMRRR
jgi:hypothetical protein